MRDRIDPDSPVALYHQIAEAIRYRIATGELRTGRRLPSLRSAAARWGVNLHTVRRAYASLAEEGIVAVRARVGAVVLGSANGRAAARSGPAPDLSSYLAAVAREVRERWGLSGPELESAVREAVAASDPGAGPVRVIECSETQSRDLARQIEDRWRVRAEPWSLEWEGEPPAGPLVATYFHYNDVRVRWPRRFPSVHFAATRPDPRLRERLDSLVAGDRDGSPVEVVLCERDEAMVRNIAADLSGILPAPEFSLRCVVADPRELLATDVGPLLLPPRVWGELRDAERPRPDAIEVRYILEPGALEAIGASLGWEAT